MTPGPAPVTERPWSHQVPDGAWDAVVIGSGIGGMTAAATLARIGKRVLVLERHSVPGGFTQTFKRPGYRWDVGVHIVGEMGERSFPGRLLSDLTSGRLRWEPVGEVYDEFHFPDGFAIRFPDSRHDFRDTLYEAFPDERGAIDEYLDRVRHTARAASTALQQRAMPRWMAPGKARAMAAARPHWGRTTAEVLSEITDDTRLRSVLAAQWGYYGDPPSRSSWAMHALMVAHFMWGAFYPVGGAQAIAPALLQTVASAGGWTAVRRRVAAITVDGGRVRGVRLEDGTDIPARVVVGAAGAVQTARLAGQAWDPGYAEPGPAHLSLYLGFEGIDPEAAGATRQCQWFYETWSMEDDVWAVSPGVPLGRAPVLFTSFPSLKDPEHDPGPELRHTGEVVTFVGWEPFREWEGTRWQRRPDGYDSFKQALTHQLLAQFAERFPDLAGHVAHAELSTPVTTAHFTEALEGSIYGLGTEPDRFLAGRLRPKTSIKGLYLAGVDVATPGVVGGLLGGVLGAAAVEPLAVGRYLQRIRADLRATV